LLRDSLVSCGRKENPFVRRPPAQFPIAPAKRTMSLLFLKGNVVPFAKVIGFHILKERSFSDWWRNTYTHTHIHDHSPTGLFRASAAQRDRPSAHESTPGSRKRS